MLFGQKFSMWFYAVAAVLAFTPSLARAGDPLLDLANFSEISNPIACEINNLNQDVNQYKQEEDYYAERLSKVDIRKAGANYDTARLFREYQHRSTIRTAIVAERSYHEMIKQAMKATDLRTAESLWIGVAHARIQLLSDRLMFEWNKRNQGYTYDPPATTIDYALNGTSELNQRRKSVNAMKAFESYEQYLHYMDKTASTYLDLKAAQKQPPLLKQIAELKFQRAVLFGLVRQHQFWRDLAAGYARDSQIPSLATAPSEIAVQQLPNLERNIYQYLQARGANFDKETQIGAIIEKVLKDLSIEGLLGALKKSRFYANRNIYQTIAEITGTVDPFKNTRDLEEAVGKELITPADGGVSLYLGQDGNGILRIYKGNKNYKRRGNYYYGLPAEISHFRPTQIPNSNTVMIYANTEGKGTVAEVERYIVMRGNPDKKLGEAKMRDIVRMLYLASLIYDQHAYQTNPLFEAVKRTLNADGRSEFLIREDFEAWLTNEGLAPATIKQIAGWNEIN